MVVESWFVGLKVRFDAQVTTKGFSLPPNIVYKMRHVTRCFVRHILTISFLYFPVVRFALRAPDFERAHFGQKGCARKRAPYIYIHNNLSNGINIEWWGSLEVFKLCSNYCMMYVMHPALRPHKISDMGAISMLCTVDAWNIFLLKPHKNNDMGSAVLCSNNSFI